MITATGVELRAGSRLLLDAATFRVAAGRPGRPGRAQRRRQDHADQGPRRRGASPPPGTVTRTRRGRLPAAGPAHRRPRRPRPRPHPVRPRARHDRARPARGRGRDGQRRRRDPRQGDAPLRPARGRVHRRAAATPPSPRPRRSPAASGLRRAGARPAAGTLSGGQRRRVELARILFSGAETLLLDEPTNHLDADSIVWLRDYLKAYKGGLVVISHDVELLDAVVNKVFHLDANRGRARRLQRRLEGLPRSSARPTSGAASASGQRREEGRRAAWPRPTRCAPRRPRPSRRRTWPRRAERLLSGLEGERVSDKVAKLRFPEPAPCGKTPLTRQRAVAVLRLAGGLHRRRPRHRPRLPRRRPRPQRRRQDDPAADARRRRHPRHRRGRAGPRAEDRLLRPGAREPRRRPHGAREHEVGRARPRRDRGAQGARLVPVQRRRRRQAGRRALRRREDPALAGHARRVVGQRAAARRAHQQPRPGLPRGDPRRAADLQGRRRAGHATTRAPSRRSSPSASCSCPTASRTSWAPTTSTSSRWPDR